jgi:hypothetical protein
VELPSQQGITDKILDALLALLTEKLQTDISEDDASRLTEIKVGPLQDSPSAVVVLLHENDPDNPQDWPHCPIRYPDQRQSFGSAPAFPGDPNLTRSTSGLELVGGGSMVARCFTIGLEVWGDEVVGLSLERRDVGQVASVVENRIIQALKEAGAKIGTGSAIQDDFGEKVSLGPFWGDTWTGQMEGEAMIVRKTIRLYYKCSQSWGTSAW